MMAAMGFKVPIRSHTPVLLGEILKVAHPIRGRWLDATIGAGGYAAALLKAGASHVTGIDRDPSVFDNLSALEKKFDQRLKFVQDLFSNMGEHVSALDGVVLDLGVSSMQLDQGARGFSFLRDGPLDMRMSQSGQSAADLVNTLSEVVLADTLFVYGEERASRRIAKAIIARRRIQPFERTLDLAELIKRVLPKTQSGQAHPATRTFQALRIAVNNEFQELFKGLHAAEKALAPNGLLVVVTFHSLEDRMVKRFFQARSSQSSRSNRFVPEIQMSKPAFELITKKAISAKFEEIKANSRARSAKLRVGRRTSAPLEVPLTANELGMPSVKGKNRA